MRYSLLIHYSESGGAEAGAEAVQEAMAAFDLYAKSLESAGVLIAADVLQPVASSTTVTMRSGILQVQDGPFADTKEQLGGVFLIDVPDLDAALAWAEECPAPQWGTVEIRPTGVYFADGEWNAAG